jgi:hypothetical protein
MPTTRDGQRLRPRRESSTYAQVAAGHTKVTFVCDDREKEMILAQADRELTTMSEVIRRALRMYCAVDIQQATIERSR